MKEKVISVSCICILSWQDCLFYWGENSCSEFSDADFYFSLVLFNVIRWKKKKVTWKQSYSSLLQLQTNVPPKGIHNMQINCCTGPSFLSESRWRKQTAGMRRSGDPWSVHALKNTRMKLNQRIINILYRIQISLKWEFSLNAHLHRDHSFISFYRYLSVPLAVNRLRYLCRSLDSSGPF